MILNVAIMLTNWAYRYTKSEKQLTSPIVIFLAVGRAGLDSWEAEREVGGLHIPERRARVRALAQRIDMALVNGCLRESLT